MPDSPPFSGLGEKALPFLKALGFHQNRDWFFENKALYESDVRKPMGDLVEHCSARLEHARLPLRATRKTSLFRINRDVRFSKNKDPYNTHCSAVFTRTGTKKDVGLAYIHISNDRCFAAGGFYGLAPAELRAFRQAILDKPQAFAKALLPITQAGLALDAHDDALKRNPRGFEAINDPALQTILRQKHITVSRDYDSALVTSAALADQVMEIAQITMPLLAFGWAAVDPVRAEAALKAAD